MPHEDPFMERRAPNLQSPTDGMHTTVLIKKKSSFDSGLVSSSFEMKLAMMVHSTITKAWKKKGGASQLTKRYSAKKF